MSLFFDSFTRKYALSKTLRFELVPVGKTQELLEADGVVAIDEQVARDYIEVKKLYDQLHRDFINEALVDIEHSFNPQLLQEAYALWKTTLTKTGDEKKALELELYGDAKKGGGVFGKLREAVVAFFHAQGNEWKKRYSESIEFKKEDIEILFENASLELLMKKYPEEVNINGDHVAKPFKGFKGYLTKYLETKRNLYSAGAEGTALANRMIDENLIRHFVNVSRGEKILESTEFVSSLTEDEKKLMTVEYYPRALVQKGIDSYNKIIGAHNQGEDGHKGLNQKLNEWNQQPENLKLPLLLPLHAQIMGERDKQVWIQEISDDQVIPEIQKVLDFDGKELQTINALFAGLCQQKGDFDLSGIFLSHKAFNTMYQTYFESAARVAFQENNIFFQSSKEKETGVMVHRLRNDFFTLVDIQSVLAGLPVDDTTFKSERLEKVKGLPNAWVAFLQVFYSEWRELFENRTIKGLPVAGYTDARKALENTLQSNPDAIPETSVMKVYLDASLDLVRRARYFELRESKKTVIKEGRDESFYSPLETYLSHPIQNSYDLIRNNRTKKPFSTDKVKINFGKGNLLGGWADSPEGNTQFGAFIFRKADKFFLGITDQATILDKEKHSEAYIGGDYEKMTYKQLKGQTIYGSLYGGKYGTDYAEDALLDPVMVIGRIKEILRSKVGIYPELQEIIDTDYSDPKKLATDISALTLYTIIWEKVSGTYIEKGAYESKKGDSRRLYLFEITNKDFNPESRGNDNVHTLYWKAVFSNENIESPIVKLSGGAEVFHRRATTAEKLGIRTDKKGIVRVKNARYARDQFFFHCPIVLNVGKKASKFNQSVNQSIGSTGEIIRVIGIDRGEKHLAYYSVVEGVVGADGKISDARVIDIGSFNTITERAGEAPTDYFAKLAAAEDARTEARQNWENIGKIKDLKEGYVSQVVRKIADLALQHNAFIVFEDLSGGFKNSRKRIEKSVYQKLELALMKKLSYLVNKSEKDASHAGHVLNAYQLTPDVKTVKELDTMKQAGIVLYTRANYTSAVCPCCGWRKKLYEIYTTRSKAEEFMQKLSIQYIGGAFHFIYDLRDFTAHESKKKMKDAPGLPSRTRWTLSTRGAMRTLWNKALNQGKGSDEEKNITAEFQSLFQSYNVDLSGEIQISIQDAPNLDSKFYQEFMRLFHLLQKIRNPKTGTEVDRLQCPNSECLWDSDSGFQGRSWNGDANGAYNIARKGLMMLDRIREKPEKPELFISDTQWDNFTQK